MGLRHLLTLALSLTFLSAAGAADAPWYHPGPWEDSPFGPDLAAYRAAAAAVRPPVPGGVTVIFRDGQADFQADGSLVKRSLLVYRLETTDGIQNWSHTEVSYHPWFQDRPRLRVRIVNPDGAAVTLTDADFLEVAGEGGDRTLYDDTKTLRVPYPNVQAGSLVEEELTVVSRPSLPGAGTLDRWTFVQDTPVGLSRYTVTAPAGTTLTFQSSGQPLAPDTGTGGALRRQWARSDLAAGPKYEEQADPQARQRPEVSVSSAPGWDQLAALYGTGVEAVLASSAWKAGTLGPQLPAQDPRKAVQVASRWINDRVRYTGLELGLNRLVPYAPETVLKRGFGDCKDKAALMTVLLRAAGYQAWLSLIETGPGWDVSPEVPTLSQFNHAIVYVADAGGFWYDPTVEVNAGSSLPYYDQGRQTLVAKPTQGGLRMTPVSAAAENVTREVREITLADEGRGTIRETTTYFGADDLFHRNNEVFSSPQHQRDQLKDYAQSYYKAEASQAIEVGNPHDLAKPFGFAVTAVRTPQAQTGDTEAQASVALNNLRASLFGGLVNDEDPQRKQTYRAALAFRYELEARIQPPAGFRARGLPEPVTLGDDRYFFHQAWTENDDGTVVGLTEFELRRLDYSAEEFGRLRTDLRALLDQNWSASVTFDHQGEALRAEGRYAEAFEVYRRLVEAQPQSPIQNKRLSVALLSYSLGAPAVLYAQRAADLDPKNAALWANLAEIKVHDALGRRLSPGFDRAGSIEAWNKALVLDPSEKLYPANLAIVYEYNAQGERYRDLADLARARDLYLTLGPKLDDYGLRFNLWSDEIRLGNVAGARTALAGLKDEGDRNLARVVTELVAGSKVSLTKLLEPNLTLEKHQRYWTSAADFLVEIHRYADAARLLKQAAVANKNTAALENRAQVLARIENHPTVDRNPSTPEGLVQAFLYDYLAKKADLPALIAAYGSADLVETARLFPPEGLRQTLAGMVVPVIGTGDPVLLADFGLSLMKLETQSDGAQGWQVLGTFDGGQFMGFYVVNEGGRPRLEGWAGQPTFFGLKILGELRAGRVDQARAWYNWCYPPRPSKVVHTLGSEAFFDEQVDRTPWFMETVARGLAAVGRRGPEGLQAAQDAWAPLADQKAYLAEAASQGLSASQAEDLWLALGYNLANSGLAAGHLNLALDLGAQLEQGVKGVEDLGTWYSQVLALGGRTGEAEARAQARWAARPTDNQAFLDLVAVYQTTLNFPALDQVLVNKVSSLDRFQLNNLAWSELFRPGQKVLRPEALDWARRSVSVQAEHANLHTLATIYATLGRFDEARSVLLQALDSSEAKEPTPDDWYVVGLLADGFGFHDAAREAFLRVTPRSEGVKTLTDTELLAQRRLK